MCNEKLMEAFVEKEIVKHNTPLEACRLIDIGGIQIQTSKHYQFKRLLTENNTTYVLASSIETPSSVQKLLCDSIIEIDGMSPFRLAKSFDIDEKSGKTRIVKLDPITGEQLRRGRKKKWVKDRILELELAGLLTS